MPSENLYPNTGEIDMSLRKRVVCPIRKRRVSDETRYDPSTNDFELHSDLAFSWPWARKS